jgi:hypothetical protein
MQREVFDTKSECGHRSSLVVVVLNKNAIAQRGGAHG